LPALIVMAKARYDALSPEHRTILKEASAEAVAFEFSAASTAPFWRAR
jgi:TRAP-type C4-dicarboxylate transport system substrate-binding protein